MCVKCSTHASIINGHGEKHYDYGGDSDGDGDGNDDDDDDGTWGNSDDAGIKRTTKNKKE